MDRIMEQCSRSVVSAGEIFAMRSAAPWDSGPYHSGHERRLRQISQI